MANKIDEQFKLLEIRLLKKQEMYNRILTLTTLVLAIGVLVDVGSRAKLVTSKGEYFFSLMILILIIISFILIFFERKKFF